ncbi:Sec-independent protein translocase subunit TatA [Pengzhenrongella frigida]|uniref:Sec-independent protein translocase protein TatA n=1 Tax=Pengzhenrongella frigida TaxID=1259133 RepID=A0A4Q5N0F4_9MICO|nr:Sec-independent protein translocase subunit TatA [Cellulomonas sp. HLT2-17]RYV50693.1 twin-arginine translocase TatA/TatE family subunit [Cellulomonas sp. HLT2-17]
MPNLKPMEILLIVLVVLLLFGAKRLPDLARSVGKSMKILKSEVKDLNDDDHPTAAAPTSAAPPASAPAPVAPAPVAYTPPPTAPPAVAYTEPVTPAQPADDNDRKQV